MVKIQKILHNIEQLAKILGAMKIYVELTLGCLSEEMADIATAFLSDYDFESFDTTTADERTLLHGYILAERWELCRDEALAAVADYAESIEERTIEDENWNSRWESENFRCVEIDDIMVIRALHCEPPTDPNIIDVIVAPQMSFGSGHHNTTRMMCRLIGAMGAQARVLDVGCGTGVLSIAAIKCGAESVTAVDIDPWSTESARVAAELNGIEAQMEILLGTVECVEGRKYDMVVANINRNIILGDIERYAATLSSGGKLLLSGFLGEDVEAIREAATALGFECTGIEAEEEWRAISFTKR